MALAEQVNRNIQKKKNSDSEVKPFVVAVQQSRLRSRSQYVAKYCPHVANESSASTQSRKFHTKLDFGHQWP
ncbi:Uncharacterized protein APZ42_029592 [Daphnia magna]|uniref:Uncharacterized protein n=1 Tax=Daphnia magna TaxID=35525 RepID=A0A0N8A9H5_9CRUS|nr:Uncharacterized protein APZ42_029592 [Daphnia magna]